MEENVAATTPSSKSLSCHFVEISRAGGWGEKENGSGSVCPEQAELFPKKIPFDETGQRRQSRAAHFA
jgi:hypothetical protein